VLPSSQTVPIDKNQLYYGDNYEVLQRYVKDESVDLVYLDPPFNSRQDYNFLFAEKEDLVLGCEVPNLEQADAKISLTN
jgi:16S rRNA G966 N2-methylase RsmD